MNARVIRFPTPTPRTPEHLRECAVQDAVAELVERFGSDGLCNDITDADLTSYLDGLGTPADVARQAAGRWRTW